MKILLVVIAAMLTDNLLFTKFFGIEPFFASSDKPSSALVCGGTVTVVSLFSGMISLMLYKFVLAPLKITFLATFVSVLVIAGSVILAEIAAKYLSGKLHRAVENHIPMITTNCVVLGSVLLCIENEYNMGTCAAFLVAAGAGFTLAVVIFSGVRERLEMCQSPAAFSGVPLSLVAASLAAMAFAGFAGLAF